MKARTNDAGPFFVVGADQRIVVGPCATLREVQAEGNRYVTSFKGLGLWRVVAVDTRIDGRCPRCVRELRASRVYDESDPDSALLCSAGHLWVERQEAVA